MVRRTFKPSVYHEHIKPCTAYSTIDYVQFLDDLMATEEMKKFLEHCQLCLSCLKGLAQAHERFLQKQEQRENEFLYNLTLVLLDTLETKQQETKQSQGSALVKNLFRIVIESSQGLLKLVSTTGELLTTPPRLAFRGENEKPAEILPIRVVKDFSEPPWSIQVTLERNDAGEHSLIISLLDRNLDEFLQEVEVRLSGPGGQLSLVSDEQGEVVLPLSQRGDYLVQFFDAGVVLAQLTLRLE